MPVRLAPAVVDSLLLGPESRRRQLQDFPVLGDVWAKFADEPGKPHDLLIIPTRERPTGDVVSLISEEHAGDPSKGSSVAYLHDLVVASFGLEHLYGVLIPATGWWDKNQDSFDKLPVPEQLAQWIAFELADTLGELPEESDARDQYDRLKTGCRQAAKLGLVLGVFITAARFDPKAAPSPVLDPLPKLPEAVDALKRERIIEAGTQAVRDIMERHLKFQEPEAETEWKGVIFQITLNRKADAALAESILAIKADAARQLFSISCRDVGWAVLDSGIDCTHLAFVDHDPKSKRKHRIKAAFDFRRIRAILGVRKSEIDELAKEIARQSILDVDKIKLKLEAIELDRSDRLPLDWSKVQPLIELDITSEPPKADRPTHPHGTHVAGIIGANWLVEDQTEPKLAGVCPDIMLYDFRVIGSSLGDSEFAVSAALQFIRFFNEISNSRIHGVNMSLAIRHNVRNYACGRTPVCLEAEALVANGVVVVAAAGNRGYQLYQLADNTTFESYASSSITDPGNAEGVITVGATHRQWPHTYGVSFFSSRGPTGDGRLKPDLLAPGEKITSCVPGGSGGRTDEMDGTSMAAPHVSGAAALLMSRHKELRGQPAVIKRILCETATDLKRERAFQGHGMVDVLRAIQSI